MSDTQQNLWPGYVIGNGGSNGDSLIVAESVVMQRLFQGIGSIKDLNITVLITGETGTGKELVAKALHYNSTRSKHKFVPVNVGSITDELLESELFGHVKGAFTNASEKRSGLIAEADKGTLFLDEIENMSQRMQVSLLRVIEEKTFRPVGSDKDCASDFRLIAASNCDLEGLVAEKRFREDLYHRLNVIPLAVPALRDRGGDVVALARYFLAKYAQEYNKPAYRLRQGAPAVLKTIPWKGNVRELQNFILRLLLQGGVSIGTGFIRYDVLLERTAEGEETAPSIITWSFQEPGNGQGLEDTVADSETWYSKEVLPISCWSLSKYQGAKTYGAIIDDAAGNGGILMDKEGKIIYLTPDNLDVFFNDANTEGYKTILSDIKKSRFNRLARQPFRIYNSRGLSQEAGTYRAATISKILEEHPEDIMQLPMNNGRRRYFVVTEENANLFFSEKNKSKIDAFKKKLKEHYETGFLIHGIAQQIQEPPRVTAAASLREMGAGGYTA